MKEEELKKPIKDLDLTDLFNEDEIKPLEDLELKPLEVKLKPFDVTVTPLNVNLKPIEEPKLKKMIEDLEEKED